MRRAKKNHGDRRSTRRYEILYKIGEGGMGSIYVGRRVGAGRRRNPPVAIKVISPKSARDPNMLHMFQDEARLALELRSDHFVRGLDSDYDDIGLETPCHFLVLELIKGLSLLELFEALLEQGEMFPLSISLGVLVQLCRGAHDAHEARDTVTEEPLGLVHRDISPDNVLLDQDGRLRVTDLGVAKARVNRHETVVGATRGKDAYSSPEQLRGETLDRRSDIFSMGVVAWETLLLRPLFDARTSAARAEQVFTMQIPRVDHIDPSIPPEVADVVELALKRDRRARFASAREMEAAFRSGRSPVASEEEIAAFLEPRVGQRIRERHQELLERMSEPPNISGDPDPEEIRTVPEKPTVTGQLDSSGSNLVARPDPRHRDSSKTSGAPGSTRKRLVRRTAVVATLLAALLSVACLIARKPSQQGAAHGQDEGRTSDLSDTGVVPSPSPPPADQDEEVDASTATDSGIASLDAGVVARRLAQPRQERHSRERTGDREPPADPVSPSDERDAGTAAIGRSQSSGGSDTGDGSHDGNDDDADDANDEGDEEDASQLCETEDGFYTLCPR